MSLRENSHGRALKVRSCIVVAHHSRNLQKLQGKVVYKDSKWSDHSPDPRKAGASCTGAAHGFSVNLGGIQLYLTVLEFGTLSLSNSHYS
jgi:hypothetical protein